MKQLATIFVLLAINFTVACIGQNNKQDNEFRIYRNGLIYSEQAMRKLGHIVDSLNLMYKTCELNKRYYAISQTVGHVVSIDSGNIQPALKDINNQIPFEEFVNKYPEATIKKNKLILKQFTRNYKNEEILEYEHFDLTGNYGQRIELNDKIQHANNWLFNYHKKTGYSDESLTAFFIRDSFSSPELPKKYALMVGYSDCLIDTTTTKFKSRLENEWIELPPNWYSFSEKKKTKLLDELRSTSVIGACSQDTRPRDHAVNIALLSAETYNWGVFLKAHLDIMNDRFERMSDGNYAWHKRNTYIRELETLNINVPDLMLGISFRIENPAANHYYGSIDRIGRALAETKNKSEIETALLSVVTDIHLDDYNRLIFYFLFKNYNYYIQDKEQKKQNLKKLNSAVNTLPEYLKKDIKPATIEEDEL